MTAEAAGRHTHEVRALHTDETITVYQAYSERIAGPALVAGTFVPPFKRERMTWIKPSFLWMMYRCGWGAKPDQKRVLAVDISREGFESALARSCLSHQDHRRHASREEWQAELAASPVRVQWDPERSTTLAPLEHRALQLGLSGPAVAGYVDEWITGVDDVTALAHEVRALVRDRRTDLADELIPAETPYPLPDHLAARIGATS